MIATLAADSAPFLGRDGRPNVGAHRLYGAPASGAIVDRAVWRGVPLALYRVGACDPVWRVLEPESPVECLSVRMMRAEGLISECGKWKEFKGYTDTWHGWPEPTRISPAIQATVEFERWGRTAPDDGCYDKCDFEVRWAGELSYSGRFDLQRGGTDDGEKFFESLLGRLMFLAGLHCPRHMTPSQYAGVIGDGSDECRRILATCEI